MNLYSQAESNVKKTWVYLLGFFLLVIILGWAVSYFMQSPGILWTAVVLSITMSLGSYWFSDKVVLSINRAQVIQKKDNPELYRVVENLAITAGLPMPKVAIIKDAQPNAFATGRDAKHAVVAVTTGLLEKLERVELEGVLAHELSHIGNRDMLISTIAVVLVGFVVLLADFFFRASLFRGSRDRQQGGIAIIIGLVLMIIAPIVAQLLKLAISRKREFLADATGALLTRYPEGLAKALEKISQDANPLKTANDATAHLYLVNPFKGKEGVTWIHKLFMTHPPVQDRIKILRGMKV